MRRLRRDEGAAATAAAGGTAASMPAASTVAPSSSSLVSLPTKPTAASAIVRVLSDPAPWASTHLHAVSTPSAGSRGSEEREREREQLLLLLLLLLPRPESSRAVAARSPPADTSARADPPPRAARSWRASAARARTCDKRGEEELKGGDLPQVETTSATTAAANPPSSQRASAVAGSLGAE